MLNKILKDRGIRLILGSQSPRRKMLLKGLDVDFDIITADIDENYPKDLELEKVPIYLACKKSKAIREKLSGNWILLTADTIVLLDNEIIGKPLTLENAKLMLKKLSGKMHTVITGVCLTDGKKENVFDCKTKVWFKKLSDEEIDYYLQNYNPVDKAGAYGVQEWIGYIAVEKIEGSYFNVVGLPVQKVYLELLKFLDLKLE